MQNIHDCFFIEELNDGKIAVMPHGFGIHHKSKFTSNGIYDAGVLCRRRADSLFGELSAEPRTLSPDAYVDFNKFHWVPWSRLAHTVGAFVTKRMRMQTPNSFKFEDAEQYLGKPAPITKSWDAYIPVQDRLDLLTRVYKGVDIDRYRLLDIGCGVGNHLAVLAAHGFDTFGMEGDPNVFSKRHFLMRDRIVLGDALQDLYAITRHSFNVAIVSCVGSVWWGDLVEFFTQCAGTVVRGGIVIVDIREIKGREFRERKSYTQAMLEAGIHVQVRMDDMLVGTVKHDK
jgi:hypothetical protein